MSVVWGHLRRIPPPLPAGGSRYCPKEAVQACIRGTERNSISSPQDSIIGSLSSADGICIPTQELYCRLYCKCPGLWAGKQKRRRGPNHLASPSCAAGEAQAVTGQELYCRLYCKFVGPHIHLRRGEGTGRDWARTVLQTVLQTHGPTPPPVPRERHRP